MEQDEVGSYSGDIETSKEGNITVFNPTRNENVVLEGVCYDSSYSSVDWAHRKPCVNPRSSLYLSIEQTDVHTLFHCPFAVQVLESSPFIS